MQIKMKMFFVGFCIYLPTDIFMEVVFSLSEINSVVQQVWQQNKHQKLWLFYAGMGCGKTTFINALCKYLGVEEAVSSPTFSIINEYNSKQIGTIYHLDLYRLKDEAEAIDAGVEDVLFSNNYCFVEWPEKAKDIMPEDVCKISIELIDDNRRMLVVG